MAVTRPLATIARRRLGADLARYRERAGLSQARAAAILSCHRNKITLLENALANQIYPDDVAALLDGYGVPVDTAAAIVMRARTVDEPRWWTPFRDLMAPGLAAYVDAETEASVCRMYAVRTLPGLLQTGPYADLVESHTAYGVSELDRRQGAMLRVARQRCLTDDPCLRFHVVLDGSILMFDDAPGEVLREQWNQLLRFARLPNVTIQIIPGNRAHSLMNASTTTIFTIPDWQDIVSTNSPAGMIYPGLESASIAEIVRRWETLVHDEALSVDASMELIEASGKGSSP